MRRRIIICCNDQREADYIKQKTDSINKQSQKQIESFVVDTPNLKRLDFFLNTRLLERTSTVGAFKVDFIKALDNILNDGNFLPDKLALQRIRREFLVLKAKEYQIIVDKTQNLISKHKQIFKEEEACKVFDIYKIETVTNYNDLHGDLSDIDGLVVPCELSWDHEGNGFNSNEYKGITLVQYLRSDRIGINIPIIFISDHKKEDIINKRRDSEIIRTPALQHRFIDMMEAKDDWATILNTFKEMRKLNESELKYTQLQYCDLKGMLVQIKHAIKNNPNNSDQYKSQIEYILAKDWNNNYAILEEYQQSQDLEAFCIRLINLYENGNTISDNGNEFIRKNDEKPIDILYLEDNIADKNADRFIKFIKEQQKQYNNYRFTIKHISNSEECYKLYNDYDVIIADIEILNKDKELIALGSEVIKNLIKKGAQKLFYIVTNVTRSFYDQIKIPGINRIRLKQEVFGSKEKISTFLYGIKEAIDHRQDDDTKYKRVFDKLYAYTKNSGNYPISYKFKKGGTNSVANYNELEIVIRNKTLELVKEFLRLCYGQKESFASNELESRFCAYDEFVCPEMQDYVGANIGKGESKLIGKVIKQDNNNETTNPEIIKTFITRLVLRRFYVFVREFVLHYNIKTAGDDSNKEVDFTYITVSDLACRAINGARGAYKKYKGETGICSPNQSKCLSGALMLSENEEELFQLLDAEELAFITAINNSKDAFDYTSDDKIQNLTIDY